jgi:hypothetical protein
MAASHAKAPGSVHILFVHGVGQHSRLSSLLQAYQSVRSNVRSPEAPGGYEDPIPNWKLDDFNDGASPPYVKLRNPVPGATPSDLYFYEINYSQLAGVVRANHPIDLTRLFVGFDQAVNWSRTRLVNDIREPNELQRRNIAMAGVLQKLSGVFVAATVPILGLPSVLLRNYTRTFVGTFTRFFEDVVTFAMDSNGGQLISAHMDRTVADILGSPAFADGQGEGHGENLFVIAAHSLGTVVAHNYLVRQWQANGKNLPAEFLTFGSPIGLVCWLWLFLDFPKMDYTFTEDAKPEDWPDRYFSWEPNKTSPDDRSAFRWINVINHLDPIATAFPIGYADLSIMGRQMEAFLQDGDITHRYIKTGGLASAGATHSQYFDDRKEEASFIEILLRIARVRSGDPAAVDTGRTPGRHWIDMDIDLMRLRVVTALGGFALVCIYLAAIAGEFDTNAPWALLLVYAWPGVTLGALAFWQRLIYGGSTKRTSEDRIGELRWRDLSAVPYLLRHTFSRGGTRKDPVTEAKERAAAAGPGRIARFLTFLFEFGPTAIGMLAPIFVAHWFAGRGWNPFPHIWEQRGPFVLLAVVFILYLMCFAVSQFFAHWRAAILAVYPEAAKRDS